MNNNENRATENKEIRAAIAIFNKAVKKYREAEQAHKDAEATFNAIWDKKNAAFEAARANGQSFKDFTASHTGSELEAQEKAATTALKDTEEAENMNHAIFLAASSNVAKTAANELKKAMQENPEKFSMPTHYKKFNENIAAVIGNEFWIETRYSAYVHFKNGSYGYDSAFFADIENGTLNFDRENAFTPVRTVDYATLKQDARKAKKLAEKVRKEYDKVLHTLNAGKAEITSDISYFLPRMDNYIKDDYRFF